MIDTSQRDLYKYYNNSWLGYRTEEKVKPFLVRGVTDNREFDTAIGLLHYQDPCIEYQYPDLGMVVLGGRVYYCTRRAARQWIKGVRTSHLVITELVTQHKRQLDSFGTSEQRMLLERLYNNRREGVQRLAAKVNGELYYRTKKLEEAVLENPSLSYIKEYISDELEDIVCE